MKRSFLVLLLVCIVKLSAHAQLKIEDSGNVAVKTTSSPIYSDFCVNTQGSPRISSYFYSNNPNVNQTMMVVKRGLPNHVGSDYSSVALHIDLSTPESPDKIYGLYSHVFRTNGDTEIGRSYGIYSYAGNSTPGFNYGVFGTLCGQNKGTGIYGSSVSGDDGAYIPGRFAGYFNGNVRVTGTLQAGEYLMPSDIRLKEKVEQVKTGCLDDIMDLSVIKYNLKQRYVDTSHAGDTAKRASYYEASKQVLEKKHYGLIAQELQTIYPELVQKGEDGYLSVNYMELIPILVQTIQELNEKVDNLSKDSKIIAPRNEDSKKSSNVMLESELFQNSPNPFTEETEVKCYIPSDIYNADLYIYDMNGRQIEKRNISERGNVSLTIKGGTLDAGIYLYSLITDGQVIDTKRMILTK